MTVATLLVKPNLKSVSIIIEAYLSVVGLLQCDTIYVKSYMG